MANVFILEDDPYRIAKFLRASRGKHELTLASTSADAKALWTGGYDLVFLDHDLTETMMPSGAPNTGSEFAEWMPAAADTPPEVYIHSHNHAGSEAMYRILRSKGYFRVSRVPFTPALTKLLEDHHG